MPRTRGAAGTRFAQKSPRGEHQSSADGNGRACKPRANIQSRNRSNEPSRAAPHGGQAAAQPKCATA
eukprot:7063824-Alexandrium_andersonii.AAC.1